jgi:hypothetical protein
MGYVSSGADCAWIDYVIMPVIAGLEPACVAVNEENFEFQLQEGDNGSQILQVTNVGEADLFFDISVDYPDELGRDLGGPDEFGYIWKDSNSPGGPEYNWIDISDTGTLITFNHNDIGSDLMPMDFSFNFYGIEYNEFRINPNGWIGFGDDNFTWANTELPNAEGPAPAIMPFWDDLYPWNGSNGGGDVYYFSSEEYLIVTFDDVIHYPGDYNGTYDFQTVIYPNGNILLQYREVDGDIDTNTIGIQNEDGSIGLQIAYNEEYVANELAVIIKKVDVWLSVGEYEGLLSSAQTEDIELTAETGDLEIGTYNCSILISSNDPVQPVYSIPIELEIIATGTDDFEIPGITSLIGNYPNPFNPTTKIKFGLKNEGKVYLEIYNLKGQKVTTLVDEILPAGFHEIIWEGKDDSNRAVSSGIYFYRLHSGNVNSTKKMMMLK